MALEVLIPFLEQPFGATGGRRAMSTLIAGEVYIRIADDQAGFVCTVKDGKFSAMLTELALHWRPTPDVLGEKVLVLARKRSSRLATREEQ
jgi:hypothetical protein